MPGAHFAESPEEEHQSQEPVEYPCGGFVTINWGDLQEEEGTTSGEETEVLTRRTQEMCRRLSRRHRQRQERSEQERRLEEERQQREEKDRETARLTREAERQHREVAEARLARRFEVHEAAAT